MKLRRLLNFRSQTLTFILHILLIGDWKALTWDPDRLVDVIFCCSQEVLKPPQAEIRHFHI